MSEREMKDSSRPSPQIQGLPMDGERQEAIYGGRIAVAEAVVRVIWAAAVES
jgi:hypothetical protein